MIAQDLQIAVERLEVEGAVALVRLAGRLDGETYGGLLMVAQDLQRAGVRRVTLDVAELESVSGAGLAALQHVAELLEGQTPLDLEQGWEAIHAIARHRRRVQEVGLRVIHAQPAVLQAVQQAGMETLF